MPRIPESAFVCSELPFVEADDVKEIGGSAFDKIMPRLPAYEEIRKDLHKYLDIPVTKLIKDATATECVERVRRRALASCGIPSTYLGQTEFRWIEGPSLSELLEEVEGKKEDNMDSLMDRKIKKVVIECEDGSTYEGSITRIEGNPYNLYSTMIEACVRGKVGDYGIKEVIFANPSTIVKWTDGTTTVVTCQDNIQNVEKDGKKKARIKPMPSETYSKEVGLAMCIAKKWAGNKGNYNNIFRKYIEGYTEGKK